MRPPVRLRESGASSSLHLAAFVFLSLLGTLFLTGAAIQTVHAQTVTNDQVTLIVSPVGGTQATFTLSGGGVSPGSVAGDGSPHGITCNTGNPTVTITQPTPGSNTREEFAGPSSTRTFACDGTGHSFTYYSQQSASADYSGTVASSGAPSISGTQFGAANTATLLTTTPTTLWYDQGTSFAITKPAADFPSSTERYETDFANGSMSAGISVDPTFYHQFAYTLSYSVSGGGSPTAPTLQSTQFGSRYTPTLTTSATGYWLDNSAGCTTTNPTSGSTSTERWDTTTSCPTVSATQTVVFAYYHQFVLIYSYSVTGGGSPTAPTLTITQFGSSYTPTITGSAVTYWADNSASWSVTNPLSGSGSTERWDTSQTVSGTVSATVTTAYTYYLQYLPTYQYTVTGGGSPTVATIVRITQFGGAATVTPTLAGQTAWTDSGTTSSYTNPISGAAGERWDANSGTLSVISSAATMNPDYYHQYSYTLSYSVTGGGSPTAPTLASTQFGASYTPTLTTGVTGYWLDNFATCSVTNPASGSTLTERWDTATTCPTVSSTQTILFAYYHQYSVSVGYSVVGGGSPTAPTLTATQFGSAYMPSLTRSVTAYWLDSGQSWSVTNPLGGSGSTEQWDTSQTVSGTVSSSSPTTAGGSLVFAYYHQYALTFSYAVVRGGSGYAPPTLNYSTFGASTSVALTQNPIVFWSDAGSSWTATNPLPGSSASERWQTNQTTNGASTNPATLALSYYHQYPVVFVYSVIGGGTGYGSPSVNFTQFGARVSGTQGWADAGSAYSFTNPLPGSSSTERWYSGDSVGSISATSPVNATYYHQYAFLLRYSVLGGGGYSGPSLNSSYLGASGLQRLSTSQVTYWLDSSKSWSLTNPLGGSGSSERWDTSQTVSGTVGGNVTTVFTYYNQYLYTLSYSITYGGSGYSAPTLTSTQFGGSYTPTLTTGVTGYWLDNSATCSVTNPLSGSGSSERWDTATACPTVSATQTVVFAYVHQYYVDSLSNSVLGGSIRNVTQWYNSGTRVILNATASDGWRFMYWKGVGSASYNGTESAPPISVDSPANETAIFYAGLTLHPDTNGYLTYSFGSVSGNVSAGSEYTVYVPPGTNVSLKATPESFAYVLAAWAGDAKGGDPETSLVILGPQSASASFVLDYADISVVVVAIPLVVVLSIFILAVRRWPRGQA